MEGRLEMKNRQTPPSDTLALPNHPTPPADLVVEPRGERSTIHGAPALQTDRLLERLGPRRLAEIRARLASGVYGSPEVLGQLAMRILESGDLT